ncbi:MAG: hypothetical protein Q4E28_00150 [Clostridia bacterium]|nr:hypothetical protein [Clostridia bacterium]
MSYCVKCGVELDENVKKCPLCKTQVIKPYKEEQQEPSAYSAELYIPAKYGRRIIAFYLSIGLLIPNLILIAFRLMFPSVSGFVKYVVATSLFCFFMFLFPLLQKKIHPHIVIGVGFFDLLLYLAFFAYLFDDGEWFIKIALPITCVFGVLSVSFLIWIKITKRNWRRKAAFLFVEIAIMTLFSEFFFTRYYKPGFTVKYSIIIAITCLSFALLFIIADRNNKLQNWISKKFTI